METIIYFSLLFGVGYGIIYLLLVDYGIKVKDLIKIIIAGMVVGGAVGATIEYIIILINRII